MLPLKKILVFQLQFSTQLDQSIVTKKDQIKPSLHYRLTNFTECTHLYQLFTDFGKSAATRNCSSRNKRKDCCKYWKFASNAKINPISVVTQVFTGWTSCAGRLPRPRPTFFPESHTQNTQPVVIKFFWSSLFKFDFNYFLLISNWNHFSWPQLWLILVTYRKENPCEVPITNQPQF